MTTDWIAWHAQYDDPDDPLVRRLGEVRRQIGLALDRAAPGPIRLLSLCAGRGLDVLPVLAAHARGAEVVGRLVELDPALSAAARAAAPASIEVVCGDAGSTAAAAGAAPVDLLLLCGIFGNISDEDIAGTAAAVPALLAPGGTVIWTRHTYPPDITPRIRGWFTEAGVTETAYSGPPPPGWSVGAGVLTGPAAPLPAERRLFTFLR